MNIKPGIAVLVIGPTVTGCCIAMGMGGTVEAQVDRFQRIDEARLSAAAGWVVKLGQTVPWDGDSWDCGIFPQSSLMPLNGEAKDETESTNTPIPAEVA